MHYQQMGKTDFRVSDIVLGTYKFGARDWGAVNDLDSLATIQYCVDHGMNLIDTATGYGMGRAERLIRYALDEGETPRRGKTRIMTKFYLWEDADDEAIRDVSPAMQRKFLTGSKKRLGVEKLDIVLLHADDLKTPIETAVEELAKMQAEGHIEHIGVSNYTLEQLQRAQKVAPLQNYQPHFSLLSRGARDDGRLDFCRENGISVGCFGVIGKGLFAQRIKEAHEFPNWDHRSRKFAGPEFEKKKRVSAELAKVAARHGKSVTHLAIAWVLSHPAITFALLGFSNPAQAEHNLQASGFRLSKDEMDECEAIVVEGLK